MFYIEEQEKLNCKGLGKYNASYNGCAPIALHNLCLYYNINNDLTSVKFHNSWDYDLHDFISIINERLFLDGKFGARPTLVYDIIRRELNCITKFYFGWNWYKKIVDWNYENRSGSCVLMYWSGNAIHYIFVENNLTVHNSFGETLDDIRKRLSETLWPCIVIRVKP